MDIAPGNFLWDAWHPRDVAARLSGMDIAWCVAGGWAVDLVLGERTRPHHDLEIAVPAQDSDAVRDRLGELEFFAIDRGALRPLGPNGAPAGHTHQTWAVDRAAGRWRLDVFREPADGGTWICRRDPAIRRRYAEVVEWSADGVPYLAPEIAILFKAKGSRPRDEADLALLLPRLDARRRLWLIRALARLHPGSSLARPARGGDH